jgi:hypothetical protein
MRAVEQLVQPSSAAAASDALADLGIRYVVLHKLCLEDEALDEHSAFLSDRLSGPVYDDRWIRVFEVPGGPQIESP